MATDLTWQQLQNAIGVSNAIKVTNGKIVLDPSLITGDSFTDMSDIGVLEFVTKLLEYGKKAQDSVNSGVTSPNRLSSFSDASYGAIQTSTLQPKVTVTRQISVTLNLDINNPNGINI